MVQMDRLHAKDAAEWNRWLETNHSSSEGVWLVFFRKGSGKSGVSYDDALDAALCFGWVDSMIMKIDGTRYMRKFTPRRLGSIWSRLNIERVERLTKEGRMREEGLRLFRNRTTKVSQAERFKVEEPPFPREFLRALKKNERAWENFQRFAPSHKRRYLMWLTSAKKEETLERRIGEAVEMISKDVKDLLK